MRSAFVAFGIALAVVGTAEAQEAKPKSNPFARAKVLSKNALSITIRHSDWGEKNAYQFAADHCAQFGKLAIRTTSSIGVGADSTTTWICQEPPKPETPAQAVPPKDSPGR